MAPGWVRACVILALMVVATGCGGGGGDSAAPVKVAHVVQVGDHRVLGYAIAPSSDSDFRDEANQCARDLYDEYADRLVASAAAYCWVFPSRAAFERADVDPDGGGMTNRCWVAFGKTTGDDAEPTDPREEKELGGTAIDACP